MCPFWDVTLIHGTFEIMLFDTFCDLFWSNWILTDRLDWSEGMSWMLEASSIAPLYRFWLKYPIISNTACQINELCDWKLLGSFVINSFSNHCFSTSSCTAWWELEGVELPHPLGNGQIHLNKSQEIQFSSLIHVIQLVTCWVYSLNCSWHVVRGTRYW